MTLPLVPKTPYAFPPVYTSEQSRLIGVCQFLQTVCGAEASLAEGIQKLQMLQAQFPEDISLEEVIQILVGQQLASQMNVRRNIQRGEEAHEERLQ